MFRRALGKMFSGSNGKRITKRGDTIDQIFDRAYGFYTESYFREMLVMERKRSERSRKPFFLILIEISSLLGVGNNKKLFRKLMESFKACSRETDIKGWYKSGEMLGIIFTEADGATRDSMLNKVSNHLTNTLGAQKFKQVTITCYCFPDDDEGREGIASHTEIGLYDTPKPSMMQKSSMVAKRTVDIAGSLFAIVIFSPLFLLIPLLIKLNSKGPVLFIQKRVGLGGAEFPLFKFRSMHVNNDDSIHQKYIEEFIKNKAAAEEQGTVFKIQNDPRITKVGKWLRKTSLDELPQFFNVLMGHMSLVGPRPPIRYELKNYDLWHLRRVLEIKPGITGIWQVEGRSMTTFDNMVRLDIQYIQKKTLMLDLKLLAKTPLSVINAKGAM
ncbi:MAG: sugar transferase [Chitinivibrionales bacterium]